MPQARDRADRVSQWLLDNGHNGDNPVAILSDNSLNFAVLQLGAMQVGIPAMPVSPAYSLMSKDFAKVRYVCDSFTPSLIYVEDAALFKPALAAVKPAATIVATKNADAIAGAVPFDDLLAAEPGEAVERAYAAVTADSIGKILLTSGSTGLPKGVINTQRLMCSSVTQIGQVWPFLYDEPPAICDWLPWNHTFAANFSFNMILRFGGTYWMDEGKPVPGRFEATLRNLREVKINQYLNVARAYDMLVPALEADPAFAEHVLGDCQYLFYAGAGLPQALWDRIEALSIRVRGARIPDDDLAGLDRDRPAGDQGLLAVRPDRDGRPADPRPRSQAGAGRRQDGNPLPRPQHRAGLLPQSGKDGRSLRRRGLLQDRRRREMGRRGGPDAGPVLRRPGRGEFQIADRHLGRHRRAAPGRAVPYRRRWCRTRR